jgi:hypothetical protein
MVDTPFMKQFRDEYISTFEYRTSKLRVGCTPELVIKGNQAEFLVSGSGGASAVTRGPNGDIPFSSTSNTQSTCTLLEKHGPFERTGFNIFASQGDQRKLMMEESVGVINRDIEDVIITQLDTATQDTGAAVTANMDLIAKSQVILFNNDVDPEDVDNLFCAITPAFRAYLEQTTEFTSGDYVEMKTLSGAKRTVWRWHGFNWIVTNRLTGNGTAAEKCYMWHKRAMGYAANTLDMAVDADYERKHQKSWVNATVYHGALKLQNTGIVQMLHDGSAYVAS